MLARSATDPAVFPQPTVQINHILALWSLSITSRLIHTTAMAAFSEKDIHTAETVDNVDKTVDNQ